MAFWNSATFSGSGSGKTIVNRVTDYMGSVFSYGNANARALTNDSAFETAAVLSAVKVIAQGIAQTPLNLKQTYYEGDLECNRIHSKHWAHNLLRKKPNSWQTPTEFLEGMMINAILGTGALAIKNIVGDEVRELIPVPAGSFTVETLSNGSVQYTVRYSDGTAQTFSQEQVLFFRGISLDGYTGVSMIDKARAAIGLSYTLENQQLQLAAKGGNPSGILSTDAALEDAKRASLRTSWNTSYGPGGSGGVAILDKGLKFYSVSQSLADSQFIENRKFQIEEIARVFNIQPLFLGHNAGVNVDGADAAMRFHVKNCLMPWMVRIEQALNRDILGNAEDMFFDFDERELLRGDFASQVDAYIKALGSGGSQAIFSLNEVRYEFGENPINEDWAKVPSKGGYADVAGMNGLKFLALASGEQKDSENSK